MGFGVHTLILRKTILSEFLSQEIFRLGNNKTIKVFSDNLQILSELRYSLLHSGGLERDPPPLSDLDFQNLKRKSIVTHNSNRKRDKEEEGKRRISSRIDGLGHSVKILDNKIY